MGGYCAVKLYAKIEKCLKHSVFFRYNYFVEAISQALFFQKLSVFFYGYPATNKILSQNPNPVKQAKPADNTMKNT
jgi:hypothetical protein